MRQRHALSLISLLAVSTVISAACVLGGDGDRELSDFFEDEQSELVAVEGGPEEQVEAIDATTPDDKALLDVTQAPRTALEAVQKFYALVAAGRFEDAYRLASLEARELITVEQFAQRYRDIWDEATITAMGWEVVPPPSENVAGIEVTLRYETSFFGEVEDRVFVPTRRQPNWVVDWSPDLIFSGLGTRGNLVNRTIDVPDRGSILDRNGEVLAFTGQIPVIGVARGLIQDEDAVVALLTERLSLDEQQVRNLVFQDVPPDWFIPVGQLQYNTDPAIIESFVQLADMGILVQTKPRRIYPQGELAAHVVGFLGEVNPEELEALRGVGYLPGDRIGRDGVEALLDSELSGARGGTLRIIASDGREVRVVATRAAVPGRDVVLTIDVRVQRVAEAALGEEPGAIVVQDPRTNEILALVSFPRFDPNDFIRQLSQEEADAFFGDERQPFLNRSVEQLYPPGSTFKIVTMAAALEAGGFEADTRVDCPAVWTGLGDDLPLKNWKEDNQGLITLSQAIAESCNTVFYEVATALHRANEETLTDFAAGFGFGKVTGVFGLREEPGINPGPDWKRINVNDFWYTGDTVNMSIGQGFLAVTPLQLSNAYVAIASDGILRTPLLVSALRSRDGVEETFTAEPIGVLPISAETLSDLRAALRSVIADPVGTGWFAFRGSPLLVAGKSGTAEDAGTVIIEATEEEPEEEATPSDGETAADDEGAEAQIAEEPEEEVVAELTERLRTHALFVAYANTTEPKVLVTVVIDDGESGASVAGPIARLVLERSLLSGWVQ